MIAATFGSGTPTVEITAFGAVTALAILKAGSVPTECVEARQRFSVGDPDSGAHTFRAYGKLVPNS
jgi:hypothetical protein